jgi:hypothetical protein
MAAVLLDNSVAALRAVELASIPNFLLNHEDSQLLLIHGLTESRDVAQHQAVPAAIDAINKSRIAQHTLNYKIEMCTVQSLESPTHAASGPTPANPTPTPVGNTPGPGDKSANKPAAKKVDAKGSAAADSAPAATHKLEKAPEEVAAAVAGYVRERCSHHDVTNVLLGVGSAMQGKSIAIGSVARAMVKNFRSHDGYRLFMLKATGPVVRPTAPLRMIVLVVPGQPLYHLQQVLELASPQQRGDRIGVLIIANNGQPKPDSQNDLLSVNSPSRTVILADDGPPVLDATAGSLADVAKQCATILAKFGLSDAVANDDGTSTVANETFPLVNHLVLEPTNQLPTPTVDDVPQQLVKFVASIKCDFLVLPPASTDGTVAGEALVNACLAAPKPHVLLM